MKKCAILPAEALPCTTRLASWRCAVLRILGLRGGASHDAEHLSAPEPTNAGFSQIWRPTNICKWCVGVYALTGRWWIMPWSSQASEPAGHHPHLDKQGWTHISDVILPRSGGSKPVHLVKRRSPGHRSSSGVEWFPFTSTTYLC